MTQLKIYGNELGANTIHTTVENSVQASQDNHKDGKVVVAGELGNKLDELLTRYQIYGLSGTFLVAKDDQIVLHKGYGLADRERKLQNSPMTLFEMGSLTKTFTAAAILRLEMQGKLKTSDSISKYLGKFPKPKDGATIHHLLTHTAGLVVEGEEQLFKPAGLQNLGFRGDFARDDQRLARGYLGTPERIEEGPPFTGFDAPNLKLMSLRFDVASNGSVRALISSSPDQNVDLHKIAKQE